MEEPMRKLMSTAVAAALVVGVVAAAISLDSRGEQQSADALVSPVPSSPVSTTEQVEPYVLPGLSQQGGNLSCDQIGVFEYTSERTNYSEDSPDNFTVDLTDTATNMVVGSANVTYFPGTKTLDFAATIPIEAVIVKGSADANIYDYRPDGTMIDTGLGAPPNASGGSADLSNLTLCSNPQQEQPSNSWCSPGYWRNHPAAWEATGISPTALYSSYFDVSTLSKKATNMNPTLGEVLKAPQTYGGPAFNNVGDLLSDAHPDVNFTGQRTEDSCPLS